MLLDFRAVVSADHKRDDACNKNFTRFNEVSAVTLRNGKPCSTAIAVAAAVVFFAPRSIAALKAAFILQFNHIRCIHRNQVKMYACIMLTSYAILVNSFSAPLSNTAIFRHYRHLKPRQPLLNRLMALTRKP